MGFLVLLWSPAYPVILDSTACIIDAVNKSEVVDCTVELTFHNFSGLFLVSDELPYLVELFLAFGMRIVALQNTFADYISPAYFEFVG